MQSVCNIRHHTDFSQICIKLNNDFENLKILTNKNENNIEKNDQILIDIKIKLQELIGQINQLKLAYNELKEDSKDTRKTHYNFFSQIVVGVLIVIVLTIVMWLANSIKDSIHQTINEYKIENAEILRKNS
jgi:hypothetical protein